MYRLDSTYIPARNYTEHVLAFLGPFRWNLFFACRELLSSSFLSRFSNILAHCVLAVPVSWNGVEAGGEALIGSIFPEAQFLPAFVSQDCYEAIKCTFLGEKHSFRISKRKYWTETARIHKRCAVCIISYFYDSYLELLVLREKNARSWIYNLWIWRPGPKM